MEGSVLGASRSGAKRRESPEERELDVGGDVRTRSTQWDASCAEDVQTYVCGCV